MKVKVEDLKYNFDNKPSRIEGGFGMDDIEISRSRRFWYLGFIVQDDGKLIVS